MSLQICDRLYWPEGKTRAFTFSYDDGIEQDARLMEIAKSNGITGTFNLNPGLFGRQNMLAFSETPTQHYKWPADVIAEKYKGFEVAAHGLMHTSMYGVDQVRCVAEILDSRRELERLLRHQVEGYAYAFGVAEENVISAMKACGMLYGRTITSTKKFEIPQDLLRWDPTCHHDDPELLSIADRFLSDAPEFSFYSPAKLFYLWGHAYEFDQFDHWNVITELFEKVGNRDDVWYATNQDIADYIRAYRRLIYSVDGDIVYNPSSRSVWIGSMFTGQCKEIPAGATTELLPAYDM